MSKTHKGIDLSYWNGKVNWDKVAKEDIDFALLRIGHCKNNKETIDAQFENNYAGATKVKIPIGGYFFSYALNEQTALNEAKTCYNFIKDKNFQLPIYYDIEEKNQLSLSKERIISIYNTFSNYLTSKGIKVGLYSMDSAFSSIFDSLFQSSHNCWVARVGGAKPQSCKKYDIWQYSWKGTINGITGNVDLDYCYNSDFFKDDEIEEIKDDYTFYITKQTNFKTDINKNVISTYSFNKHKNIYLSNHFQVKEFASKNGTKLWSDDVKVHNKLIQILEALFNYLDCSKIIVNSGYRTKDHDKSVGGSGSGYHTLGRAADITCYDKKGKIIPSKNVCIALEDMGGIYGIGYITPTSTHVDTRPKDKKWWGDETKAGAPNINKLGYTSFHKYFKI